MVDVSLFLEWDISGVGDSLTIEKTQKMVMIDENRNRLAGAGVGVGVVGVAAVGVAATGVIQRGESENSYYSC